MNRLREESKQARLLIEQAGFGDVISLDFKPNNDPPLATICSRLELFSALDDDTILDVLKTASEAGTLLEGYGWEVEY